MAPGTAGTVREGRGGAESVLPAFSRPAAEWSRTALVLGATGLVGGHCLDVLLADPAWTTVTALVRRPSGRVHPRLRERVIADFGALHEMADAFQVDAVFCALGTTLRTAGSREAFRRVDHDYPVRAARLAAEGGAGCYLLVSAAGARSTSRIFYNRVKGEAERDVAAARVASTVILRPSLLLGRRGEGRPAEAVAQRILSLVAPVMTGRLRRYRPVEARTVARAMVRLARESPPGVRGVESDEIERIGGGAPDA